nr:MAG TPA: baseplate wedge protein [Caudoviricetes sp.]
MRYRALDANGDFQIGNGHAYIEGAEAVQQAILTRLRLLLYEWWEDIEDGVPYWQKIIAHRDVAAAEQIIRDRIQQTPHVLSILSFDPIWDNENRRLTIRAAIQSEYGALSIDEEV